MTYPRIASLKTHAQFRDHLAASGIDLPLDETLAPHAHSPLAAPIMVDGMRVGNRFCVLPMEGWDGTADGHPSDLTRRRWRHFGISGAKLIWGGEAVAVRHDGRANPHQLLLTPETHSSIEKLRTDLVSAHRDRFGGAAEADLAVGLQLTHSGRFSRPDSHLQPKPLTACPRPVLDRRFPQGVRLLDDGAIDRLVIDFVIAAKRAREAGFAFIDFKHCHGYFAHELLGARPRQGRYGGSLENRMRFTREVIRGVHAEAPGLKIVVRLSVFDTVPYRRGEDGVGEPEQDDSDAGFGLLRNDDMEAALHDAKEAIAAMHALGVRAICVTAGTPYYNPHVLRPATFPPVDGYGSPEDPLRGVARHIDATARLKAVFPDVVFVGSGYSYLQEWLPHVAQHTVAHGMTDLVGLGRQMLSYPEFAADLLAGRPLKRKHLCRTFSDCTTGPRIGVVSGCYPLDAEYLERPDAARIRDLRTHRTGSPGVSERPSSAQVHVAATAFFALFSVVGLALYGLPLYYDFMVREFGWSRTMVTSGNALSKLVVGPLFGFAAGWIVDRFGPRRLMMAGILMAGSALVGLGAVSALWMFYFFYLFNALGYVCGGPLPNQVLLSRWFDRTRGKAMGFAYLGIGIGGALVPLLGNWLTSYVGWRMSLQIVGALIVLIAFPLAFTVREQPPDAPATTAANVAPIGGLLRSPAFYLLAIGSMCSIAAVGGTNQHLKLFLSLDRGYSQADAARVISMVLAFSIAGRLLMGWLADRMRRKHVMLLIYMLIAVAIPLLFLADSPRAMYGFAFVFGLGLGGEYLIIPLMAAELFGVRVLGRVMGIVLTADGVAEATAPMLVGYLRDVSGSYETGFLVLIGAALAGALAIALLPRHGTPALAEVPRTATS